MKSAQYWINHLSLEPHPEGGYFREMYRATEQIAADALPARFQGARCFATSIVYLLKANECSVFHRILSDETWHFYAGSPLELFQLDEKNPENLERILIGTEVHSGQHVQWTVPAGVWFGSRPLASDPEDYALLGCTVSPGFDFRDFEMGDRAELLKRFPLHCQVVTDLAKRRP